MIVTKRQLRKIVKENLLLERMAPKMGKNAGQTQTYIDPKTQERIDFIEKELGTSNFFDEVMERIPMDQMKTILSDIQREYGYNIDGFEVR
jgi:hypothetical protein